jgi:hypothetical protein
MRALSFAVLAIVASHALAAEETRDLPEFKAIKSTGAYRLIITAGQPQSVVVSADEAVLSRLSTKVIGDELVISTPDEGSSRWKDKATIRIGVGQLGKLKMAGVGETTVTNLSSDIFKLDYEGVGAVKAQGKVKRFVLSAEGVGSLNARALEAQQVDVSLGGVGSVTVYASESLDAKVGGIGSLTYYGKPARVSKSAGGIGGISAGE